MNISNINLSYEKLKSLTNNLLIDKNIFNINIKIVIIGSQSIYFHKQNINVDTILQSPEIDVFVEQTQGYNDLALQIGNQITFAFGEGSLLHIQENFFIDDLSEQPNHFCQLTPKNWKEKALSDTVNLSNNNTLTFLIPSMEDILINKLIAHRDKDLMFIEDVIRGSIIQKKPILNRLKDYDISNDKKELIEKKINKFFDDPQKNILKSKKKIF